MAIFPESGHANFSNFFTSQILTKPSLFSSAYQVRVNDQIWAKKVHFCITLNNFVELP